MLHYQSLVHNILKLLMYYMIEAKAQSSSLGWLAFMVSVLQTSAIKVTGCTFANSCCLNFTTW